MMGPPRCPWPCMGSSSIPNGGAVMYAPVGCRAAKNFLPANGQLTAVIKPVSVLVDGINAKCRNARMFLASTTLPLNGLKSSRRLTIPLRLGTCKPKKGFRAGTTAAAEAEARGGISRAGCVRSYQYLVVLRLHNKQTHRCRRALGVDRGSALRHEEDRASAQVKLQKPR